MREYTTRAGLRIRVAPAARATGRVAIALDVRQGSLQEREPERGLAHFLEHCVLLGSAARDSAAVAREMQALGVWLAADTNAQTDFRATLFHLEAQAAAAAAAADLLADLVFAPALRPADVERERGAVLAELEQRGDQALLRAEYAHVHGDTLLPLRMPAGSAACVRAASADSLRALHARGYLPCNATVLAVGDVDADEFFAVWDALTASWGAAEPRPWAPIPTTTTCIPCGAFEDPCVPAPSITLAVRDPLDARRPMRERALALLLTLACTRRAPKAELEICDAAGEGCHLSVLSLSLVDAAAPLAALGRRGVSDAEFAALAEALLQEARRRADAPAPLEQTLQELVEATRLGLPFPGPAAHAAQLEEALAALDAAALSAFAADALGRLFAARPFVAAPPGQAPSPDDVACRLAALWAAPPPSDSDDDSEAAAAAPRRLCPPTPTPPPPPTPPATGQVHCSLLPNGLPLTHRCAPGEGPCAARLVARGGRSAEPAELRGAATLGLMALCEAGVGEHSADAVAQFCAQHALDVDCWADADTVAVEVSFPRAALAPALDLLCGLAYHSAWEPDAFARARAALAEQLGEADGSAQGRANRRVAELAVGAADARFALPRRVLPASASAAVRALLRAHFAPANAELLVVGDLDGAAVEALAGSTFGCAPAPDDPGLEFDGRVAFCAGGARETLSGESPFVAAAFACASRLGRLGAGPGDLRAGRALVTAQSVLECRLRRELRAETGLVYDVSVGAALHTFLDGGLLTVSASPQAGREHEVADRICAVVRDFARRGCEQAELDEILVPFVASLRAGQAAHGYWLAALQGLQLAGGGRTLADVEDILGDYGSLTAEEVSAARLEGEEGWVVVVVV